MNIKESICKNSDCYLCGLHITPKGLMLHSVGCNQPDANVFARNWNNSGGDVCAHAVIGLEGLVVQTLPWNWRGWHGGGSSNNTHIGVEMTEPSTIEYTSGADWVETGDGSNTKKHVLSTYNTAVELFAYLCKKFNLNPLGDGVIVSHSEGYKRGIASGHADVEHLWKKFGLSMDKFRQDVNKKLKSTSGSNTSSSAGVSNVEKPVNKVEKGFTVYEVVKNDNLTVIAEKFNTTVDQLLKDNPEITDKNLIHVGDKIKVRQSKEVNTKNLLKICDDSVATWKQLAAYAQNKGVSAKYVSLAKTYIDEGAKEGIRGDIAFAQSILETGNFKFGGDVKESQNNFAGLGATGKGVSGESFSTPEIGIRAQIQHLKAYATTSALNGECVDTRFKYVERGSAPYVEWLGIPDNPNGKGWAAAQGYGSKIISILAEIIMTDASKYKEDTKPAEDTSSKGVSESLDDGLYRVRLSWDNEKSQLGAFKTIDNAKKLVDTRTDYKVYDDSGKCVYEVKAKGVSADKDVADYTVNVPAKTNVYEKPSKTSAVVQTIKDKGVYTIVAENSGFGKLKSGVGYILLSGVSKTDTNKSVNYIVKVTASALNIRNKPNGDIIGVIRDKGCYTIVAEEGEWGKLKSGAGWINLKYTDKI